MIVDDNDMVRMGLRIFLRAHNGVEYAGEAATGREAVARLSQLQPDVILLDLHMPEIDGIATAGLIKELAPQVHIILLSGNFSEGERKAALEVGVSECLFKDLPSEALVARILAAQLE